jgi:hypothetical protein
VLGLLVLAFVVVVAVSWLVALRLGALDQNMSGNSTKVQFCLRGAPKDCQTMDIPGNTGTSP